MAGLTQPQSLSVYSCPCLALVKFLLAPSCPAGWIICSFHPQKYYIFTFPGRWWETIGSQEKKRERKRERAQVHELQTLPVYICCSIWYPAHQILPDCQSLVNPVSRNQLVRFSNDIPRRREGRRLKGRKEGEIEEERKRRKRKVTII